jgi:hypothetical protein
MDSGNGGNVTKAWIQETVATLQKLRFRKWWQHHESVESRNGGVAVGQQKLMLPGRFEP